MKTKTLSPEQKALILKEYMALVKINTPYPPGKDNLFNLCDKVGIKQRIAYFNMVEKPVTTKARKAKLALTKDVIPPKTEIRKVVHHYGLIFNNGFEIRNVDKKVFDLYKDVEVKEVRERIYKDIETKKGTSKI
jgi:hypothetical protein